MLVWGAVFIVFSTSWDYTSAVGANFKCYSDLLVAKLKLERLLSDYDEYLIEHNKQNSELNAKIADLQANMTAWSADTALLKSNNDKFASSKSNLSSVYADTEVKITHLKAAVASKQKTIAINVNKISNIDYANAQLETTLRKMMLTLTTKQASVWTENAAVNGNSTDLASALDILHNCYTNITSTSKAIASASETRTRALLQATATKRDILSNDITYATALRRYNGLEFCSSAKATTITGNDITPHMIKLCEILDLDEVQSCRANVTANRHDNTVALGKIDYLEKTIDNKTCTINKYAEETMSCKQEHRNCEAFLSEKQMIVQNRRQKESEDSNATVTVYRALLAAMKIYSEDKKYREMTKVMTKLESRVIYKFEADFIYRLRSDIIKLYLLRSRTYLCSKINCILGHSCVLRTFKDMFPDQHDAFIQSVRSTLLSVGGHSARFYAKQWSLTYHGIPPFLPDDDSTILPPADLTRGYELLPENIIFQTDLVDLLDPDVAITRWLFEMKSAFGIPSPAPQELFFINAMNTMMVAGDATPQAAAKYTKCKCVRSKQCGKVKLVMPE